VKIFIIFLFIILLNARHIDAQEIFTPPVKPNTAFRAGENLTYNIHYGFLLAGTTTLSLTDIVYTKKEVFHASVTGQTVGLANIIYRVKDIYESWFDKETNLPYKQVRNVREGHYERYNEVTYNRINNTVESKLSGVHSVPEKILDLTSTIYYVRRVDFSKMNKGNVILVNMYFSDEIFPFRLIYMGTESISTKFGKISCHKICPIVEVGRIFKRQDDLTIWFTDDANCLPVLVRMDIRSIGIVNLQLIKYENIVNPLIIQK
jgi:uncharacterized protein with HEPN domain